MNKTTERVVGDGAQQVSAPVYNSTYTLFRLSPLYVPDAIRFWEEGNLNSYARRFTDSIQSDNLQVANPVVDEIDETINKAGPFKQCRWQALRQQDDNPGSTKSADDLGVVHGLQVNVEYEKATYTALLLNGVVQDTEDQEDRVRLPLVCIRMPARLRSSFVQFVAITFDTRMEPLVLDSTTLCRTLENFLQECMENEDSFETTVKEIQLTLSLHKPTQSLLRSMDVAIKRADVPGFLKQGGAVNTISSAQSNIVSGPFLRGLQKHLQAHLALNLSTKEIAVTKIACGAFALGKEGKMKLFAPNAGLNDDEEYDAAAMASRRATGQVLQNILQAAIGNT